MSKLMIAVLGSFQVSVDGTVITSFRSDKARALLAYLAVESDQPHRREALAALFWPDCAAEAARNNLRQTLYVLRQALSVRETQSPFLIVSQRDIRFDVSSDHWLDVTAFTGLLEPCPLHAGRAVDVCPRCVESLRQAGDLYRGDFLKGLSLVDAVGFDEWLRSKQEQYHHLAIETLSRLSAWYERRREYDLAVTYAQRQLELEPWREEAHCCLMRVLALDGKRSAALRQYELCRETLAEALGVEPSPTTTSLYAQIVGQTFRRAETSLANPYKGLHAFGEIDAADFFGREAFVDRLLTAIRSQPVVGVIGASGSGKSSIIFAGLAARLAGMADSDGHRGSWLVARFRPGTQPFTRLAAALLPSEREPARDPRPDAVTSLAAALAAGQVSLAQTASHFLMLHPAATRLLLVADQFEELFALTADPQTQRGFLDVLLAASTAVETAGRRPLLCLLIGLRADFMGQALAYRPLADALERGSLMLGPMSQSEMMRAIEEPARGQGVIFEAGLVGRLLEDVGPGTGNLPLLEFALTSLWEHRVDGVMTHDAYAEIGGVDGALAQYAEDVFGAWAEEEQARARSVFLQLVRPGQQTNDTRRVATRAELGEDGWVMARRLADARLAVTGCDPIGRETAEIVHEALITGWRRLQEWIDADRAFRLWQEGLRTALAQWQATGQDAGALLRGAPLAEAEQWLAAREPDIDAATQMFITGSIAERQAQVQAAEQRRQREIEQARAVARAERRTRRRMLYLSAVLCILAAVALLTAIAAVRGRSAAQDYAGRAVAAQATAEAERSRAEAERTRAEGQARLALSHQLAAQAGSIVRAQPDLAVLLSLEASARTTDSADQANLLLDLTLNPYLERFLPGAPAPIYLAGFDPTGGVLSTLSPEGAIQRWDMATGRPLGAAATDGAEGEAALGLSPDGSAAALGRGDTITVWDLKSGRPAMAPLKGHATKVRILAFSADNHTLVSGDVSGTILRWDLPAGISTTVPFTDTGNAVWAMSRDGRRLALTLDPGQAEYAPIVVRDLLTGQLLGPPMLGHKAADGVHGLVFSPDGKTLASSSFDKTVILWDAATGLPLHPPLHGHTARALVAAFSPDGRLLASGGADNQVLLWDVKSGEPIGQPLAGHSNWVRALAFSPDGKRLASASADGVTILWNLSRSRQLTGFGAKVRGLAFSGDGRALAAGSLDQAVRRFDVAAGTLTGVPYAGDGHSVLNVALSPDGGTLAVASASGDVALLDGKTLNLLGPPLHGHTGVVVAAAFSPDGRTLATGGFDNSVILWDVATRTQIGTPLAGHRNWVMSLAFSPDGKLLASGDADAAIILWDVATRRAVGQPLRKHTNWVDSLAFSPDGQTLASGSSDNTIMLWNVQTREPLGLPLEGHAAQVWTVVFDPADGGRTLVSAGANGSVIRWDVATHAPLSPPLFGGVEIETMAVSPDGQTVALGGFDNETSLWQLDRRPWQVWACALVNRNLTPTEWRRYLPTEPYHKTCPDLP